MARDAPHVRPVRGLTSARLGRSESPRGDDRESAAHDSWAGETIASRSRLSSISSQLARADEKAGQEADHHRGHVLVNRILSPLESVDQLLELLLPLPRDSPLQIPGSRPPCRCPRRTLGLSLARLGHAPDPRSMQSARRPSCFSATSFFASKFRWIDSRTSFRASAMSRPGGWRGPPWSSLRIPRTSRGIVEHHGAGRIEFGRQVRLQADDHRHSCCRDRPVRGLSDASASCRLSTACSIFRSPRTLCRI